MAANLVITPEAATDLDEAYAWYESQDIGRGEDFLGRVDACIQATLRFPEMHALFHGNYRRALVRKYPYAVFYENLRRVLRKHRGSRHSLRRVSHFAEPGQVASSASMRRRTSGS